MAQCEQQHAMKRMFFHSGLSNSLGSASTATIFVPGLRSPLRCMHLSDSHTDVGPDSESGSVELCENMYRWYNTGPFFDGLGNQQMELRGYPLLPLEALAGHIDQAVAERVQVLVHTGDLLNFPSPRAARHAHAILTAGDWQLLYVSGNHDWQHSPPMSGSADGLREAARAHVLAPLFGGRNSSHWAEDINGILFVGIDNSAMNVTEEQLKFFENATLSVAAAVLMIHVPIFIPQLLAEGMKDGVNSLQPQHMFGGPDADETTQRFVASVCSCQNLAAVLAGHIHDATAFPLTSDKSLWQYTVDAGCYGGSRILDFVPMPVCKL